MLPKNTSFQVVQSELGIQAHCVGGQSGGRHCSVVGSVCEFFVLALFLSFLQRHRYSKRSFSETFSLTFYIGGGKFLNQLSSSCDYSNHLSIHSVWKSLVASYVHVRG